jgi:predicted dinucleotide-binding enzyme
LKAVSGFYAGDDPDAKRTAALLLRDIGLDPVDSGPLEAARMLEGVADFIRRMMSNLGVYATVSVRVLPEAEKKRFGGRTPTRLA